MQRKFKITIELEYHWGLDFTGIKVVSNPEHLRSYWPVLLGFASTLVTMVGICF